MESKMKSMPDVYLNIVDMLEAGNHPAIIGGMLEIPIDWVYGIMEQFEKNGCYSPVESITIN